MAYIRRLDRLYDDLEHWSQEYTREYYADPAADPREKLLERSYALAEAMHRLLQVREVLSDLRRVR